MVQRTDDVGNNRLWRVIHSAAFPLCRIVVSKKCLIEMHNGITTALRVEELVLNSLQIRRCKHLRDVLDDDLQLLRRLCGRKKMEKILEDSESWRNKVICKFSCENSRNFLLIKESWSSIESMASNKKTVGNCLRVKIGKILLGQ